MYERRSERVSGKGTGADAIVYRHICIIMSTTTWAQPQLGIRQVCIQTGTTIKVYPAIPASRLRLMLLIRRRPLHAPLQSVSQRHPEPTMRLLPYRPREVDTRTDVASR
jgi:hypothetical protein